MKKAEIILGAGCFWGVEESFRTLEGVLSTEAGYAGGVAENPTYEDVCSKATGHAEVVRVEYDRDIISDNELLRKFFTIHDPTQVDRQGPDVGDQYRSVVFYTDENQKDVAESMKEEDEATENVQYATQILQAPTFYPGEEYHQKYLMKRNVGSCAL